MMGQVLREERHVDVFVRRFYGLRRREWVAVALVAIGIMAVNKLVVHDTGNTWTSLTLVSFYAGLLAVHGWRTVIRRRQPLGEPIGEPNPSGQG